MELVELLKHCPPKHITALNGKCNFKTSINGTLNSDLSVVDYLGGIEHLDRIKKSLKMVLYDNDLYKHINDLCINDKKKIELASKLLNKNSVIFLDYFEKGFNNKEILYFKKLFKKIVKYDLTIIVKSNDIVFLNNLADRLCIIQNYKITNVFNKIDWYDDDILNLFDNPEIIKFVKKIKFDNNLLIFNTMEINDLIKSIYRVINK